VALVTRIDVGAAVEFDWAAVETNIQRVRPGMRMLRVSAKTGEGMVAWLESLREFHRLAAALPPA